MITAQSKPGLVAVIVPTFAEPRAILQRLAHLPAYPGVAEVVVVDASDEAKTGAHSEKALKALNQLAGLKVIRSEHKGRGVQMNIGAAVTRAPQLLFLHADTLIDDEVPPTVVSALQAGYHWGRFNVHLDDSRWPFRMIEWMMNKRSAITHIATGDQALFMTREAFDIVGGFDEIALMEDIAISKKLKRLGPICAVPLAVQASARRWQQLGITKTIMLMWRLRLQYFLGAPASHLAKSYQQVRTVAGQPIPSHDIPIFVFAKAPVAGQVKSRLCPPLKPDQAAVVAIELLKAVSAQLAAHWSGPINLAVTPDVSHHCFVQLEQQYQFATVKQSGRGLGRRMLNAIDQGLKTADAAVVVGADVPAINAEILRQAQQCLLQGDCVVGPSSDGGFYLLGLNAAHSALFDGIEWGGADVYKQLMANALAQDIAFTVLPQLDDCDHWQDVQRAADENPSFAKALDEAWIDRSL